MHIFILASAPDIAAEMQTVLSDAADQCSTVATWSEVVSSLKNNRPDLLLVERAILSRTDLSTLHRLAELGRWPPTLFIDTPVQRGRSGVAVARRLVQSEPSYYQIGNLHIDTRKRRAKLGERWVTLPPIQYGLLLALAKRAGEVVGCQELLRAVWGYEAEENEARELVKVHIRQIRRRLGLDPETHHYIRSIRGFGYMLAAPDEE